MRGILTFNLPEEKECFKIAQNGLSYFTILCELKDYRRKLYKYEERDNIPREEIIGKIDEILEDFSED